MVGNSQPLERSFAIVKPDGTPTDYFIRWAQQKQIDIASGITSEQALAIITAYLADHELQAGSGITLSPSGNISDSPTIAAEVQAILDQITDVRGSVLFRGENGWEALGPGTSGYFLKTNGADADPEWASAGGGGGGGVGFIEETVTSGTASSSAFASKGTIVDLTEDVTLFGCKCTITTSGTYKLVVAKLETAGNTITSILGSSGSFAITATATDFKFALSSSVDALAGDRIAFIIVRTDGISTSICGVIFPSVVGLNGWSFNYYGCVRYASLNPAVSDAVLLNNTSTARMALVYGLA